MSIQNRNFELSDYKFAFEKFKAVNGHYPSYFEIEACEYLPSARTIQRQFRSLRSLRKALSLDKADLDLRSSDSKNQKKKETKQKFDDVRYELESKLVSIYTKEAMSYCQLNLTNGRKIAYRLFYASNRKNLPSSLNWQLKREYNPELPNFIICLNKDIDQLTIDNFIQSKKTPLPPHVKVIAFETFLTIAPNNFEL